MDKIEVSIEASKGEHFGGTLAVHSKKVLQPHPISFRRAFNSKLDNEMLEEEKLRKGIRSAKYKEVGENSGFKEIMLRKTYINLYKFNLRDL